MRKHTLNKLEALYAQIPKVECKGLCHESCTLIPAGAIEMKRAKERLAINPFKPNAEAVKQAMTGEKPKIPSCRALKDKRCTIYHIRPAICRLYAAAEGLECPFGCEPKGKKITKQEAYDLIRKIETL